MPSFAGVHTSYHNHTTWSDGRTTVDAMVEAAASAGLDEVGISDHFIVAPPERHPDWSMKRGALPAYIADVRRAAAAATEVTVRVGLEVDFLPDTAAATRETLAGVELDYIIGSVHFVDGFPVDEHAARWGPLSQGEVDDVWRGYWLAIADLAGSGLCDFVGHLDLPKKFGHLPVGNVDSERSAALDAIARAGIAVEINTAGWHRPIGEAYPSSGLLAECRTRGISLVINADAHEPAHLARDFARAAEMARGAGYREVLRYERRRATSVPL